MSEPRLYQRGRESVELDKFLDSASNAYDDFKKGLIGRYYRNSEGKKVKITDKDISGLDKAYNTYYRRLDSGDNKLTYRYDNAKKGFNDALGEIDASDPYNGLIAKFFGDQLRKVSAWTEPTQPTQAKKTAGDILKQRIFGTAGTVRDFMDRDKVNGQITSNTVRSRDFVTELRNLVNDLKNNPSSEDFTGWTDEEKANQASAIEGLYSIFEDGDKQVSDDEYLALARTLGIRDLRNWFGNTYQEEEEEATPTEEESRAAQVDRSYRDFINWIGNSRYRMDPNHRMINPVDLNNRGGSRPVIGDTSRALADAVNRASLQDLTGIIQQIISSANGNTPRTPDDMGILRTLLPNYQTTGLSTQEVLSTVLQNLQGRTPQDGIGGIVPFNDNSGNYYIIGTRNDSYNTGYTWNPNTNTLSEMSIHNIPYWRRRIINEYRNQRRDENYSDLDQNLVSAYPIDSFKQGGVLKAQQGRQIMNRHAGRGVGITGDNPWLAVPNTEENAYNTNLWNDFYKNAAIDEDIKAAIHYRPRPTNLPTPRLVDSNPNATLVRQLTPFDIQTGNYSQAQLDTYLDQNYGPENVNRFWNYGYKVDEQGNPIKDSSGNQVYGINAEQLLDYLNNLEDLGSNLQWEKTANATNYLDWNKKFDQTGLNFYFGKDVDRYHLMGPSTWSRHALLSRMKQTYVEGNPLVIDNKKIIFKDGRWQSVETPEETPEETTPQQQTEPEESGPESRGSEEQEGGESRGNTGVDETDTTGNKKKKKDSNSSYFHTSSDLVAALFGAARLPLALRANKRVEKAARPHLSLHNPLNLYLPITGDYASKQSYHNAGADIQSKASRNTVSDSSLMSAQMLDAARLAYDNITKGDIIDNQAIRKSQDQQFDLQSKLAEYNLKVSDYNRDTIAKYLDTLGLLKASRIKKDWSSIDNYFGGIEQRLLKRISGTEEQKEAYETAQDEASNSAKYEPEIQQINNLISEYKLTHDTPVTKAPWYTKVQNRQIELAKRLANDNRISRGKRKGWTYIDTYKDNPYEIQDWSNIIV